jgi:hypothetical protein
MDTTKALELIKRYEQLKEEMKTVKEQMDVELQAIGVGQYFQDPETKIAYRVAVPSGKYVFFDTVIFERTRKTGEKSGSMSLKDAKEHGCEVE